MSIFTSEIRGNLFSVVDPDIRGVITRLEEEEEWTFILEEAPEVYNEISVVVKALMKNDANESSTISDEMYDRLIVTLSSISFSYSIVGLCHLDQKKLPSGNSIAEEVVNRAFRNMDDGHSEIYPESLVVKDRVSLFIESGLLVNMFSGLIKEEL